LQPPKLTLIQGGIDPGGTVHPGTAPAATQPAANPALPPPAADDTAQHLRIIEALLFAASEPLDEAKLVSSLSAKADVSSLLAKLQDQYASRGVNLVQVGGRWAFRTASDLSYLLQRHTLEEKKLSKAALETLSIIAYHQPVTRAEIEDVRGVSTSKGTLDVLMETGWVRPRGRRRAPGKPITYGTTANFLDHFGLATIKDLPGLAELKGAGLLDANLPPDFRVPEPTDVAALLPDELPLDAGDDEDVAPELPLDEPEAGHDDGDSTAP
jgi:segregation and condensation protein B